MAYIDGEEILFSANISGEVTSGLTEEQIKALCKQELEKQKGVYGGVVPMPEQKIGTNSYIPCVQSDNSILYRTITFGTPHYGNIAGYDSNNCLVSDRPVNPKNVANKKYVDEKFADVVNQVINSLPVYNGEVVSV